MEFSAKKSEVLKELNLAQGVVERKTTLPILSNLLLEAKDSSLTISATDLELGVRCGCPAKVKKDGVGTVPAKRLLEIVRSLPEAEIRIKLLENHWIQLTCERSSFKLVGMAKDSFPVLPSVPKALAAIPAQVFSSLIQKTIFAISNEESRYTLNGALLMLKPESVAMVATDGHRLALIEQQLQVSGVSNELRVLVPKKAMGELQKFLAACAPESRATVAGAESESPSTSSGSRAEPRGDTVVQLSKDESHLFFTVGERLLISRMLTGQFPNYEAVLPRDNKRVVELDKNLITAAIRRVALLADERSRAIRIQLDKDKMEVFSSSGEYGEAHETLDAVFPGEAMQIGFDYQYLLDFLNVMGDGGKIRLELKDEQSAGQLRPAEGEAYQYRYVVMPMRI